MTGRDRNRWVQVEGEHGNDPSYVRAVPTEETNDRPFTAAELLELREPEIDATESAIELAEELGIDLAEISGSGVGGRIIKSDVEAAAD